MRRFITGRVFVPAVIAAAALLAVAGWRFCANADSDEADANAEMPAWLTGCFQLDGEWQTNAPASPGSFGGAWHVPADREEGMGSLFVVLDRSILTNDLLMELTLVDYQDSSLYLDLLATNCAAVATNLYGNLLSGGGDIVCLPIPIPLAAYPEASIIRLWRGAGEILLFDAVFSEKAICSQAEEPLSDPEVATDSSSAAVESGVPGGEEDKNVLQDSADGDVAPAQDRADSGSSAGHRGNVIYVDATRGDDSHNGLSATVDGENGPKKTIHGALSISQPGRTIRVAAGTYSESVSFCGKGVNVYFDGNVTIRKPAD